METAFDHMLSVAKTSKFDIKKPKRTITKKQPLVDPKKLNGSFPGTKKCHPFFEDENEDRYYLVNGRLHYKRKGVFIPGVTGCDEWDDDGNLVPPRQ